MDTLGKRIKRAIKKSRWNQGQLAKELGVNPRYVSEWVNDKAVPKEEHLDQMEDLLGELRATPLGKWLLGAREEKGLSRQELAEVSGVSYPTIYNIEKEKNTSPRQETIKSLEDALKETVPEETNKRLEEESSVEGLGRMEDFKPSKLMHKEWPRVAGVYVLYDANGRPVYVGQSQNIRKRLRDHQDKWWYREEIVVHASFIKIDDKQLRMQVESIMIKFLKSFTLFNDRLTEKFDD